MIKTNGVIGTLLELLFFIITNFGKKIPILDRRKKNPFSHFGQVILWLGYALFDQA